MTDDILNVALTYITIVQDLHRRLSVNPVHEDHTATLISTLQKLVYITKYSLNLKQLLPKYDVARVCCVFYFTRKGFILSASLVL